jgi:hypothetical protein
MSDRFCIALMVCVVAGVCAMNESPWLAFFALLVAYELGDKE